MTINAVSRVELHYTIQRQRKDIGGELITCIDPIEGEALRKGGGGLGASLPEEC